MSYTTTEILESARENNGRRTVLRSMLSSYATTAPHFHTLFNEIYDVEEGELELWNGFGKVNLEKGQILTIEKETVHHYVAGKKGASIKLTLEPGNLSFEMAVRITRGLKRDGTYVALMTNATALKTFLAIMAELTNSYGTGETQELPGLLPHSTEGSEKELLKKQWIEKYCL